MKVGLAAFEHLPIKVGGLAEAVTSLGEALQKKAEVMVFIPSHGILTEEVKDIGADFSTVAKYCHFHILVGSETYPVNVYETTRRGVRIFLLSSKILDESSIYPPRELIIKKVVHFTKALLGLVNIILKKEQFKPDIIHINDWHCVLAGTLVKKYFNTTFVFTIHRLCREYISTDELNEVKLGEFIDPLFKEGELFNIEKLGAHTCDQLVTVSSGYLNEKWTDFFSAFEGKTTYVWNGTDYNFWSPGKLHRGLLARNKRKKLALTENGLEDGLMFLYVGRLDREQKGVDNLLTAFEMIMRGEILGAVEIKDELRLILLGTGDHYLQNEAQRMEREYPGNMKAVLQFLNREEIRELYGAADFCLIPSHFEPFGLVQLEAMCMYCIPIGSRVGGIKDTVIDLHEDRDNCTGRLVSPNNSAALARAIVEMAHLFYRAPSKLENIRLRGRENVINNFTWDDAAKNYLKVYNNKAPVKISFVSCTDSPY